MNVEEGSNKDEPNRKEQRKLNLVKILIKIPDEEKYNDLFLFEPFILTNEGKEGSSKSSYDNDDDYYYRRHSSSSDTSQVKLSTFLKLFVRVPDDVRLTKDIAKIDDNPSMKKKTDRKKLISYFFDDDLFDKMIEKYKTKNLGRARQNQQPISKTPGLDKYKLIFDNFKIILTYVLFPNSCDVFLDGKKYKLQGVEVVMTQIRYPPINSLRNIEGYLEESPQYEGRLTDTEVSDYVDKDDKDVDVEEYKKYRLEENEQLDILKQNKEKGKKDEDDYYRWRGGSSMVGGLKGDTATPKPEVGTKVEGKKDETGKKKPELSRERLLLETLFEKDYKKKNRDSIKLANEQFVRKINNLYAISQITILLTLFESTDEKGNSLITKGLNCNYHFAVARQLLLKIMPPLHHEDEITKKKNRVKRFKFIKYKEPIKKEEEKKTEGETHHGGRRRFRTTKTKKQKSKTRKNKYQNL